MTRGRRGRIMKHSEKWCRERMQTWSRDTGRNNSIDGGNRSSQSTLLSPQSASIPQSCLLSRSRALLSHRAHTAPTFATTSRSSRRSLAHPRWQVLAGDYLMVDSRRKQSAIRNAFDTDLDFRRDMRTWENLMQQQGKYAWQERPAPSPHPSQWLPSSSHRGHVLHLIRR